MNPSEALRALERVPDAVATITIAQFTVGRLIRRDVRAAIKAAEVRGASVVWAEDTGWLDSVFSLRMSGTGHQIIGTLRVLVGLMEAGES